MESTSELLSISEMARLRKVTTETLRHYDRIGLFTPSYISPDTGYRYYSFMQYETLGTIKELSQMGMKLEDIKSFLENRNLDNSLEILQKQHDILLEEIRSKTALEKVISGKIEFLNTLRQNSSLGQIFMMEYPDRYILSEGKAGMTTKEMCHKITQLEGMMDELAPVFASDRIGVFCNQLISEFKEETGQFDYAPFIFCDKHYKKSEYYMVVPAGQYLCVRYHGRFGNVTDAFFQLADYMEQNGLKQNGPFYTNYELDITLTKNYDETILLLQVPVSKK